MSDVTREIPRLQWICCQMGAREHYAIARALHQDSRLGMLYTDFWAGPITNALCAGRKKSALMSLGNRCHDDLVGGSKSNPRKPAMVRSWNLRALWWETILRKERRTAAKRTGESTRTTSQNRNIYDGFVEVGRRFAMRVLEDLKRRRKLNSDSIVFAYDTGALEILEWCRQRGIKSVLNQMDPNRIEVNLVRAEEEKWPGWALETVEVPEKYFARREQEWALADRVVVNSEFCREALLAQGVPSGKLVVIPLCYEVKAGSLSMGRQGNDADLDGRSGGDVSAGRPLLLTSGAPLRVLFLGQVILRKGIQYLMAAARLLEKENIHFDVVGPVGISVEARSLAPRNITFHGRAGREATTAWYQRSHVFLLPTLSDGFALTQLEAMAHGLPVITTPRCGAVVSDGIDGFIVPPRDVETLANLLVKYLKEPQLLQRQSAAALIKARRFTLPKLTENLIALENDLKKTEDGN